VITETRTLGSNQNIAIYGNRKVVSFSGQCTFTGLKTNNKIVPKEGEKLPKEHIEMRTGEGECAELVLLVEVP
jgi:hypothetical protein